MKKVFGWYVVPDPDLDSWDNIDWCSDTFGPANEVGRWFYASSSRLFYFKNQRDAMLFELGFSSKNESLHQ